MSELDDLSRQTRIRLERLAEGISQEEQVFDACSYLADVVESVRDPESRFTYWGECLSYVTFRSRQDWHRITGEEPPLEGPTL